MAVGIGATRCIPKAPLPKLGGACRGGGGPEAVLFNPALLPLEEIRD